MNRPPYLRIELATVLCFELGIEVPEWVEVLPPGTSVVGRGRLIRTHDTAKVMTNTKMRSAGSDLDAY